MVWLGQNLPNVDSLHLHMVAWLTVIDDDVAKVAAKSPSNPAANIRLLFVDFTEGGKVLSAFHSSNGCNGGDSSKGDCGKECHIDWRLAFRYPDE